MFVTSMSGQRAVVADRGGVCSRAVNGGSGRSVRKRGIAARPAKRRLVAGGGVERANDFARPITDVNDDASSRGGIGNAVASGKVRQLTPMSSARASAQRVRAKIFRHVAASGRGATNIF